MAVILRFALLALVLAVPLAFADVGPSPAKPTVVVNLVTNGQPEGSVEWVTYNCLGAEEEAVDNAVAPAPMNLTCSNGRCTNDGAWYYKLNQCFSFPGGHFTYVLDGRSLRSGDVEFESEYDNYEITIDAPTGQVKSTFGSGGSASCTGAALVLGLVAAGAAMYSRI